MDYDFPKMIDFLVRSGMSYREIAKKTRTTCPTVSRVAKGQPPRFDHGVAIIALYEARYAEMKELLSR